jgi:hypothetical protein
MILPGLKMEKYFHPEKQRPGTPMPKCREHPVTHPKSITLAPSKYSQFYFTGSSLS